MIRRIPRAPAALLFALSSLWSMADVCRAGDAPTPFEAGTWNLSLSAGYTTPIRFSEDKLAGITLAGGYYFWDNNSANLELQGYYGDRPDGAEAALIGGVGILMRWHFFVADRWSLFLDGGGSVTYADHEIPIGGTQFNFIGKVGLGATYELKERTFLTGGARYFHLSNGQIDGKDENPSYDGIQFWAGVMWTW